MDVDLDVELAIAEVLKRFRSAVRLEMTIAGDRVIGKHMPAVKLRAKDLVAQGGLPALETGMGSWARKIADDFSAALQDFMPELPGPPESPDDSK